MNILASTNLSGLSKVATAEYLISLADRNPLPLHPALYSVGDRAAEGSINVELSEFDLLGTSLPQPIAEGALVGDTAISRTSYTVTIGRYSKAYSMTDLAKMVDLHGVLSPSLLAQDAGLSHSLQLTNMIAALGSGWSASKGSTGTALTYEAFLDAVQALDAAQNAGPAMAVLAPKQWNQIAKNLALTVGGAVQYDPKSIAGITAIMGGAYKGNYNGVDIFVSTKVPNDGTDYFGQIFARGGVLWGQGVPPVDSSTDQALIGPILFERDRTARAATTAYVSHSYLGVTRGLQARGIKLISGI